MKTIKTICVCGAGTMGSGIAQVAAQSGFSVIQFDVSEAMLEKSKSSIESSLQKFLEKQKISADEKENILDRISFTSNIKTCIADIIIEAVIEDKNIKQQLFDELSLINNNDTIFTTNTSSISVTELCFEKHYAGRFAGMHFFNPAQLMKLVEIICTKETDDNIISALINLTKQFNKTPVVCNDSPGFIVNRVARPFYLEAMRLYENDEAGFKDIDQVMEATGFKMGPFKLMDMIGMDINYSVSNIVWEAMGKPKRLQPSAIQKDMISVNALGRKTGKGFYKY